MFLISSKTEYSKQQWDIIVSHSWLMKVHKVLLYKGGWHNSNEQRVQFLKLSLASSEAFSLQRSIIGVVW